MIRGWLAGVLSVWAATLCHAEDGDWYLLEFASNRPACEASEGAHETASDSTKCWTTGSVTSSIELREGETISMPAAAELPPAWLRVRELWFYAPAIDSAGLSLSLMRTPGGVRLHIQEGSAVSRETVSLERWVRLDRPNARQLWVRVRQTAVE